MICRFDRVFCQVHAMAGLSMFQQALRRLFAQDATGLAVFPLCAGNSHWEVLYAVVRFQVFARWACGHS